MCKHLECGVKHWDVILDAARVVDAKCSAQLTGSVWNNIVNSRFQVCP